MPRLDHKWLLLLLAFMLGMAPLVQLQAKAPDMAAQLSPHDQGGMQHIAFDENSCEGCTTAHSCGTSSCTCYQCGTCSVTILHETLEIHFASLAALPAEAINNRLSQFPSLLFRPPRA